MFVFKLSWLPYLLVIAGISFLVEGQVLPGIALAVLGGIWIYIKFTDKKSEKSNQSNSTSTASKPAVSSKTVNSAPKAVTAVQSAPKTQPVEQAKPAGKFCRHCGAKVEPNDIYCVECGEKL